MRGWRGHAYVAATALLSVSLLGCATAYAPRNATGGYIEEWRSPTELEVRFDVNDYLTLEDARDLALRRAAELALEGGYQYFRVWGERQHPRKLVGRRYASIQAQFLTGPETGALDTAEVVRDTDALARGRLSARARERLRNLTTPAPGATTIPEQQP